MGEKVNVTLNGQKVAGWLAKPVSGKGPAVVVIQEWWGLVPHVKDVTERFAKEGFVAFAPDLYHGKTTTSPDEAGRLLMELDVERAGREIAGAGAFLLQRPECASKKFGIVGFCMGGSVALYAAATRPFGAAVTFYGGGIAQGRFGFPPGLELGARLQVPWLGLYGDLDQHIPTAEVEQVREVVASAAVPAEVVRYAEADHGFHCDERPSFHAESSSDAWARTLAFLGAHLA